MRKIGLTGGIACGKSTVAAMLYRRGALVISADEAARKVVEPGEPGWEYIVNWLGKGILTQEGKIDRQKLGSLVFNDENLRHKLNEIIHPLVADFMCRESARLASNYPDKIQVIDIPLLFEAGRENYYDLIIVVASDEEIQERRLMQRDGLSKEEARKRIQSQFPLEHKIKSADFVIYNNDTEETLNKYVEQVWSKIKEGA